MEGEDTVFYTIIAVTLSLYVVYNIFRIRDYVQFAFTHRNSVTQNHSQQENLQTQAFDA